MVRPILEAPRKLVYSLVPKLRYDEVTEFLGKHFFTSETLSKTFNLFPGGVLPPSARKLVKHRLGYGTTLYVTEEDTKSIVGVMCTSAVTDENNAITSEFLNDAYPQNPKAWQAYFAYKKATMKGCNSLQELTGCTKIYDMSHLIILPEYRKFGVAGELVRRSVALGEQLDYEVLVGYPTASASVKIVTRLGFELVSKVMLNSIMVDGKPVSDDPDACAAIMIYWPKKSNSQ